MDSEVTIESSGRSTAEGLYSVAQQAGRWVSDTDLVVPQEIRSRATIAALDIVGVTVGARRSPDFGVTDVFLDPVMRNRGTLIGQQGSADLARSTFVNSYHAHLLDFDDSSGDLGGHPSTVVFPAALGAALETDASGSQLLDAYCIGMELACRIGRVVNPQHYDAGWHPTATLGVFGAAAAAARLFGLDAASSANALSLAASFANGIKASFGTLAKPLQVARAAESGVLAAQLARAGASGNPTIFEHSQGFRRVFDRANPAEDMPFEVLSKAADWSIFDPGIIIKQFPCCGSTHSAVEAARELGPNVEEGIDSVEIAVHPRRRGHVDRPKPQDALEAKFSLQYTVSRMLISGAVTVNDFTPARFGEDTVQRLMAKCEVRDLPNSVDERVEDRYGARVSIRGRDGKVDSAFVAVAEGRKPRQMLGLERVREKFFGCVIPFLDDRVANDLAEVVVNLDSLPNGPARIIELSQPS